MFCSQCYQRRQAFWGTLDMGDAIMLTFTIALSAGISVSILLGWHIYLILSNQVRICDHLILLTYIYVRRQQLSFISIMKIVPRPRPKAFYTEIHLVKDGERIYREYSGSMCGILYLFLAPTLRLSRCILCNWQAEYLRAKTSLCSRFTKYLDRKCQG